MKDIVSMEPERKSRRLSILSVSSLDLSFKKRKRKVDDDELSLRSVGSTRKKNRKNTLKHIASLASIFSPGKRDDNDFKVPSSSGKLPRTPTPYKEPKPKPAQRRLTRTWSDMMVDVGYALPSALTNMDLKRQEAIFELYQGEMDIVEDLTVVKKMYLESMRKLNILSEVELGQIFGSIEDLIPVHKELIAQLQNQRKSDGTTCAVGDTLLHWVSMLRPYVEYCSNQVFSKALLDEKKNDPCLDDFLQRCMESPFSRKLDLWTLLDGARSRFMKYPLLIKSIQKYTRPGHSDLDNLEEAVMQLEALIGEADSRTGQAKCTFYRCKLSYLYDEQHHPLIDASNCLLLNGVLKNNKGTKLHIFLYDRVLVITCLTTHKGCAMYQVFRDPLPLAHLYSSTSISFSPFPRNCAYSCTTESSWSRASPPTRAEPCTKSTKLHIFLYDRVLVVTRLTTHTGRAMYQVYRDPIPLHDLVLDDLKEGTTKVGGSFRSAFTNNNIAKHAFRLSFRTTHGQSHTLLANDEHNKRQWTTAILKAIANVQIEDGIHQDIGTKPGSDGHNADDSIISNDVGKCHENLSDSHNFDDTFTVHLTPVKPIEDTTTDAKIVGDVQQNVEDTLTQAVQKKMGTKIGIDDRNVDDLNSEAKDVKKEDSKIGIDNRNAKNVVINIANSPHAGQVVIDNGDILSQVQKNESKSVVNVDTDCAPVQNKVATKIATDAGNVDNTVSNVLTDVANWVQNIQNEDASKVCGDLLNTKETDKVDQDCNVKSNKSTKKSSSKLFKRSGSKSGGNKNNANTTKKSASTSKMLENGPNIILDLAPCSDNKQTSRKSNGKKFSSSKYGHKSDSNILEKRVSRSKMTKSRKSTDDMLCSSFIQV